MAQLSSKFIQDSAVTTAKIAADAVDKTKIAADIAGLALAQAAGGELDVQVDDSTIEIVTDTLQLKDDGVTGAKLAPAVAGSGLTQDGSGNLDVNVGDGIQISSDAVAVDSTVTRADGSVAFTADQSMGSNKLTNLATPTASSDAATKGYVDGVAQGLDIKDSVRVATTAAGTLASDFENGDTVDGVVLSTGDRILIKDQASGSENGIYTVNASGAPTRAVDADEDSEVTAGMFCFVEEGTTNADTGWVLTTNDPITVDTTALSFAQFSDSGTVEGGAGLSKSGSTLNVGDVNRGVQVNADDLEIDASEIAATSGGLKQNATNSWQLEVEPADFAGTGLEDDGADNLRLATQGNGIAGGAGSTLSVDPATEVAGSRAAVYVDADGVGIDLDNSTLTHASSVLEVKDDGITGAKLAPAVAGAGLAQDGSGNLDVQVDDSTIEIATDTLQLKDDGVTGAKLAPAVAGSGLTQDGSGNLDVNVDGTTIQVNTDQLESLKHIVETITLNGTDITNESASLSQTPYNAQVSLSVDGVVQELGVDYSISGSTVRFGDAADAGLTASDLDPTSGDAALISGDKLVVSYHYL